MADGKYNVERPMYMGSSVGLLNEKRISIVLSKLSDTYR